jgi:hypothetical protein
VLAYVIAGAIAAAIAGQWLVLVLLGCGLIELYGRRLAGSLAAVGYAAGGLTDRYVILLHVAQLATLDLLCSDPPTSTS